MEKWEKLWRDIDNRIDVNKFYSLPSLAGYYFKINDCFDGCYQMAGSLGQFFDNLVVGGRTMTRENKKQFIEKMIQDFDAVSLYPSAMHLFDGYLKGKPKRIQTTNYDEIKHYDGYFIKVRITKVGKERPFPVLNYIDDEKQTRNWSNDLVGRVLFLDKYTCEDAQEFQGVEFEILDGYYFDEGFCTQIKKQVEVITIQNFKLHALELLGILTCVLV
jgi:hypothetical protein